MAAAWLSRSTASVLMAPSGLAPTKYYVRGRPDLINCSTSGMLITCTPLHVIIPVHVA